jgi:hypothetical protein
MNEKNYVIHKNEQKFTWLRIGTGGGGGGGLL